MLETKEMQFPSLGWEDPLEEEMATHSSILSWRVPMNRGAWRAAVQGVAKSWTWLRTHAHSLHGFFFFFFLAAYRILVPQSKIEPALEVWRLNHWATGEVSLLRIIKLYSDRCCDKSKHKEQRSLKGGTQVRFGDKRGLPRGSNAWEASWNS